MDEERDEQFFLEISDNPDYILFAEELVSYVMFRFSPNYTVERYPILLREHINILFDDIIQRAIHFLIKNLEARNRENFHQMRENLEVNPDGYRILVSRLERDDIGRNFCARYFLIYCANVSSMAAFFYNSGIYIAPQLARAHIISILDRKIPADKWNTVRLAAELFLDFLGANELSPKRNCSYQSEPLSQTQEEACGKELNSSRKRKNVLFENEENRNLQLQLESEYSKREVFIKRSDRCSSEGTSDIRYSPLKEFRLSEDESMPFNFEGYKCIKRSEFYGMPRPGTSNNDTFKTDYKLEFDPSRNETKANDSETSDFAENKNTQISSLDSKFCIYQSPDLDENSTKINSDLAFEAKDCKYPETPGFEEYKFFDNSSKDKFYRDVSNTI